MKKECAKCHKVKDETKFSWCSAKHKYRRSRCNTCRAVYHRRWSKRNPQTIVAYRRRYRENRKKQDLASYRRDKRQFHLMKTFGITIEQYDAMLLVQNGVCAICGNPETMRHKGRILLLAIDHDHETGKIRGLLCCQCNHGLGSFRDNPKRLEKAAAYLRVYKHRR